MNKLRLFSLMGSISLAVVFTFSCSSDGGGGGDSSSSSDASISSSGGGSSSSSGGGNISSSDAGGGGRGNDIGNYRTVTIGDQTWIAENLDYAVEGSKCYDNDPANCDIYGRLYDWATAMDLPQSCNSISCSSQIQSPHQGICPDGWHIPSDDDWDILIDYADYEGSSLEAGAKLKATEGWKDFSGLPSGNGTDEFGFSALPGGLGFGSGSFSSIGRDGGWWIASDNNDIAYTKGITYLWGSVLSGISDKPNLKSIRCLKDQSSSSSAIPSSSSSMPSSSSSYEPSSSSSEELSSSSSIQSSSSDEPSSSSSKEPSSSSSAPSSSSDVGPTHNVVYGDPVTYGNETYQTVVIGDQTWFARNLNYAAEGSECYDDDPANCAEYGRLYDWATALTACPSGWHIPRDAEWYILVSYAGGSAGTKLKATSGWNSYNGVSGNGTDQYGFSALPGGFYSDEIIGKVGEFGSWWSSSEVNNEKARSYWMYYVLDQARSDPEIKSSLLSIRCLKD